MMNIKIEDISKIDVSGLNNIKQLEKTDLNGQK